MNGLHRPESKVLTQLSLQFSVDEASLIAGVDEVGRGALFGPVVAAAVILSPLAACTLQTAGVTDSKQLSAQRREVLSRLILQSAMACRIGIASVQEIDRLNILQASLLAMQRAIMRLTPVPDLCRIDGNQCISQLMLPQEAVVKGDQRHIEIAAASVVAKVWRDRLITRLDARFPGYDLAANKGYGTQRHRCAIATLGMTPYHRRSFKLT